MTAQASELRECEIGITPFDCPRDNTSYWVPHVRRRNVAFHHGFRAEQGIYIGSSGTNCLPRRQRFVLGNWLDRLLIVGQRQLERVLAVYVAHTVPWVRRPRLVPSRCLLRRPTCGWCVVLDRWAHPRVCPGRIGDTVFGTDRVRRLRGLRSRVRADGRHPRRRRSQDLAGSRSAGSVTARAVRWAAQEGDP